MSNQEERLQSLNRLRRAKHAIVFADHQKTSLHDIIYSDRDAFIGSRLLYASEFSGVSFSMFADNESSSLPITQIFAGKGLLAFSDEIERQMSNGKADVVYAWRCILDTNFLSELPRYFSATPATKPNEIKRRQEIESTLQFIDSRLGRSFDWTFASLENVREVVRPENPWPYRKVAAAKLFDALPDFSRIQKVLEEGRAVSLKRHMAAADEQWESFLSSSHIWHAIRRRDAMYCIMLRATLEFWKGSNIDEGMLRLVKFCLNTFNLVPMKELYFGWKMLTGLTADPLGIFDEADLRRPTDKSLSRLSALAWDLFLFRWCETLMTEFKEQYFFVPLVTTLDTELLSALRLCPVRALLMNDDAQAVEAIFEDERDLAECLDRALPDEIKQLIDNPRRRTAQKKIANHALSAAINSLEAEVRKMVSVK